MREFKTNSSFTVAEMLELVMRPSYELARAQFMGWTFGKPAIDEDRIGSYSRFRLTVSFTCVCGRREYFTYTAEHLGVFRQINVARYLTEHGSFSREHLLEDGYTEAQVREIERRGEEFDRVTREHWEREILRAGGFDAFQTRRVMENAHAR